MAVHMSHGSHMITTVLIGPPENVASGKRRKVEIFFNSFWPHRTAPRRSPSEQPCRFQCYQLVLTLRAARSVNATLKPQLHV